MATEAEIKRWKRIEKAATRLDAEFMLREPDFQYWGPYAMDLRKALAPVEPPELTEAELYALAAATTCGIGTPHTQHKAAARLRFLEEERRKRG